MSRTESMLAVGLGLVAVGLVLVIRLSGQAADPAFGSILFGAVDPGRAVHVTGVALIVLGVLPLTAALWGSVGPPGGPGTRRF